ncbi:MAG: glutamine-hydrolyzing carbamoyl-phosphate synthase small subunit [Frankiaceae bacterium]
MTNVQPRLARPPAVLVLEDGRSFRGEAFGALGHTTGEAVFATGMTGYQETLTDPSYHGQVVVQTAPHIGNTGMNDEDPESRRIWVAGYVVRDPSRIASNWRSQRPLEDDLVAAGVVGIAGVDTRALTRHLRERGAMRCGIASGDATDGAADRHDAAAGRHDANSDRHDAAAGRHDANAGRHDADAPGGPADVDALLDRVLASPGMIGADLAPEVTTPRPYVVPAVGPTRLRVAALDLGIKASTPARMSEQGIEVHVLPAASTADDLLAAAPDGVFVSNGPGDPAAADYAVAAVRGVLKSGVPLFGICFGNQVLGRALGLGTYKLVYGHRGVNQPVQDRSTRQVAITSHNHGFAVAADPDAMTDTPFGRVRVSHVALNDGVVEGLQCLDVPAFSVQYHPEAAPGPHDANGLFARFRALMEG